MELLWRLIELHVLFPITGWCSELAKVTVIRSLLGFRVTVIIIDLTPLYVRQKFNDTFTIPSSLQRESINPIALAKTCRSNQLNISQLLITIENATETS